MGTDQRQRLLLIAAIAVVGLLLADRFVIGPLSGVWKSWEETIQTDSDNVTKFSPKRAEEMQKRWADMRQASLPKELPVAEGKVLGAVSSWAGTSGISVLSVKPKWLTGDDKEAKCRKFEVSLMANGSLSSISSFLLNLETDPMPLRVESIELTTKDPKGAQLTLDLHFTGLVLLEEKS